MAFKSRISELIERSGLKRPKDYQGIHNEIAVYFENKLIEKGIFSSAAEYSRLNAAAWQLTGRSEALAVEEQLSQQELEFVEKDPRMQLAIEMLRLSTKLFNSEDIYAFDEAMSEYEALLSPYIEKSPGELEFRIANYLRERSEFARSLMENLKKDTSIGELKPGTAEHLQWENTLKRVFGTTGTDLHETPKETEVLDFKLKGEKLK